MIAYFILVHRFPEQFKRMFRAIYAPGNTYLVHIDKNSGKALAADLAAFLAPYQGVEILPARPALWGGYSLVQAELRGMARLLEMNTRWEYFINLSGQDFPLKSQGYIRDYLAAHGDTQFMRCVDQQAVRPDTMNRLSHIFIEAFQRIFETGIARGLPGRRQALHRDAVESRQPALLRIRLSRSARPSVQALLPAQLHRDESFFQTVLMNGFPRGAVVDDDLRTIDWVPDGDIKLRPRTFTAHDATWLTLSPDFFARKFDMREDSEILDILERHIASSAASRFNPAADRTVEKSPRPDDRLRVSPVGCALAAGRTGADHLPPQACPALPYSPRTPARDGETGGSWMHWKSRASSSASAIIRRSTI